MQVTHKPLVLLLWVPSCLAQIGPPRTYQVPGFPSITAPAPPAPAPPTNALPPATNGLQKCAPGDRVPGPTCTSFYMCVGGSKYATRRAKFECAPGTVFDSQLGTCVFNSGSDCIPPVVAPPATSHTTQPGPPAPINTNSCIRYQLDPTTVFDCLEEGFFPYASDCVRFYKCVVTMGCTIKGFLFSCPSGYLYDNQQKKCEKEAIIGPCDRLSDAVVQTHEIRPVVEIKPEKLDQFFESDIYWDLMPFLPNEPQRLVPVLPSTFSRAPHQEDRPFA
ncbi:probable endochitinase [Scylla paramamosain]|uniref:probable endochitinase n=1 Tax=Scylla paramamosain TaxID=85552 RepID=UPI0030826F26